MIKIRRCLEPAELAAVRTLQLTALRALGRNPSSDDIKGYRIVAEALWSSQYHKCCYCESRIPKGYNDVEHYRPKAEADRLPGCSKTHGYWWLAFNWDNLLFACPDCNRSNKNSRFPLDVGCQSLVPEESSPGREIPLLINPGSTINPVEHIVFVYEIIQKGSTIRNWWARPRNGSPLGNKTIEICGLNRGDLREVREDHYETIVIPHSRAINEAIAANDVARLKREFDRALGLLTPRSVHVGLTYDAFRYLVPTVQLRNSLGIDWPTPNLVAP